VRPGSPVCRADSLPCFLTGMHRGPPRGWPGWWWTASRAQRGVVGRSSTTWWRRASVSSETSSAVVSSDRSSSSASMAGARCAARSGGGRSLRLSPPAGPVRRGSVPTSVVTASPRTCSWCLTGRPTVGWTSARRSGWWTHTCVPRSTPATCEGRAPIHRSPRPQCRRWGPAGPEDIRASSVRTFSTDEWLVELAGTASLPDVMRARATRRPRPPELLTCRAAAASSADEYAVQWLPVVPDPSPRH